MLTKALSKCDQSIPSGLQFLDGVRDDLLRSGRDGFVVQSEDVAGALSDNGIVSVLALLSRNAKRITGVEVPDRETLTTNRGGLTNKVVVVAEGWAHEGGLHTTNALEGLFDSPHLIVNLIPGKGCEIFVGPGVGGDLVSFVVSILDTLDVGIIIDTAVVVAVEEEGALSTGSNEGFTDIVEPDIGAVIEGKSYSIGDGAFTVDLCESTLLRGSADTADEGEGDCDEEGSEHVCRLV